MGNLEALQLRSRFYNETYKTAVCDNEPRDVRAQLRKFAPDSTSRRGIHIDRRLNPDMIQALNVVKNVGETIADGQRRQLALSPLAILKVSSLLELAESSWAGHPWTFFRSRRNYNEEVLNDTYTSLGYGIDLRITTYNQGELAGHGIATIARSVGRGRRRVPGSARTSGRLAA